MSEEMVICVPGPWVNQSAFVEAVIRGTRGKFMFAGRILAYPDGKDHVTLSFGEPYPSMREAFEIAGQGQFSGVELDTIGSHRSVVYASFPLDVFAQRERLLLFTGALEVAGGLAVKVESAGLAHKWRDWKDRVRSERPFDQYRAFVTLVGDGTHYYSCGMHHFGLPDSQLPRIMAPEIAADLMNRFNFYLIVERPVLESGHTFSSTPEAPWYRLTAVEDFRHPEGDLFRNPNGLWNLDPA